MTNTLSETARSLSKAQRALILAMPDSGAKKWRAIYRDAKVRHWTQLPFRLAKPTLTGSEYLTPLGIEVKRHIARPTHILTEEQQP